MRSLMRFVLLCLMAVALPVQGFAATGALHCGAMHQRMQAANAHHHDDGADHHHAHAGASQAKASPDAGPDDGAARVGGAFKCSACAACCVGLGLPAGTPNVPQGPSEQFAPPRAMPSDAAFLTGGLDRPPRLVLA
jgi:hypothetical protein